MLVNDKKSHIDETFLSEKVDIKVLEKQNAFQFHKELLTMKVFILLSLFFLASENHAGKHPTITELLGRLIFLGEHESHMENLDLLLPKNEKPKAEPELSETEAMDRLKQKYYSVSRLFKRG